MLRVVVRVDAVTLVADGVTRPDCPCVCNEQGVEQVLRSQTANVAKD
jgi:hypothetical protein